MNNIPKDSRFEIKFVAHESEVNKIKLWLKLHCAGFYTPHPDRYVNNVYFDTYDYSAYKENLAGESHRVKLRYRWYGEYAYPQQGSLEVKCKRNYYGWKIRFPNKNSPYKKGDRWRDIQQRMKEQMGEQAKKWLNFYPQPVLINRYLRHYFVSRDGKIRATIDQKQKMYDQRYKSLPNVQKQLNAPQTLVLEFKFQRCDQNIAKQVFMGLPLRVGSHSKYITAVKSMK
ncbi:VTC domain-containing protein [Candidatus Uabimicrobium amorphum]|uniref:VTC domain-containing protein n=1 Tax=Uabimicrobium amorphum TaxID=2596890 RepID=A0A5S9IND0_UABAM|nr:VTC domain-containing protein [Candidatus Uabimicrobium amorphum]BBM84894.1 VTC domain-containing protein [Candidatus Uabimicrobium amorphum]